MTVEEYKEKLKLLEKEYDDKRLEVCKEFAFSNNPYKIGDIIEDRIGYGKILSMSFCVDWYTRIPYLSYKCQNLTRKMTVNKKEPVRTIYQKNIIPKKDK